MYFAQNFHFFLFLAMKFPILNNIIAWPLGTKIVIKWDWFWYLRIVKDQNIYLRSSFTIQVPYLPSFISQTSVRAHCAPPHVITYLPELMWNRVKKQPLKNLRILRNKNHHFFFSQETKTMQIFLKDKKHD